MKIIKFNERIGWGEGDIAPIDSFKENLSQEELEFIEDFEEISSDAFNHDVNVRQLITNYYKIVDYEMENHPKFGKNKSGILPDIWDK